MFHPAQRKRRGLAPHAGHASCRGGEGKPDPRAKDDCCGHKLEAALPAQPSAAHDHEHGHKHDHDHQHAGQACSGHDHGAEAPRAVSLGEGGRQQARLHIQAMDCPTEAKLIEKPWAV